MTDIYYFSPGCLQYRFSCDIKNSQKFIFLPDVYLPGKANVKRDALIWGTALIKDISTNFAINANPTGI